MKQEKCLGLNTEESHSQKDHMASNRPTEAITSVIFSFLLLLLFLRGESKIPPADKQINEQIILP